MKLTSILKCAALSALIVTSAAHAERGATRSFESLPKPSSNASSKSQGLPNADGHKPGKGDGKGHEDSNGKGHEIGKGHGHDDDNPDSP